jgi:hypothetical protein
MRFAGTQQIEKLVDRGRPWKFVRAGLFMIREINDCPVASFSGRAAFGRAPLF